MKKTVVAACACPSEEIAASPPSARSLRAEQRTSQILDAASRVFQRHGFHGASMAQVAAEAGMSVGHIYRYFENKEAVIAAISERDLEEARETMAAMLHDPAGVPAALLAGVDEGVAHMMDADEAALFLEVMAEGARNPKVAESTRRHHATLADLLQALFEKGAQSHPRYTPKEAADLSALVFAGLRIRAIQDPEADQAALARTVRAFVADLLGEPASGERIESPKAASHL